MMDPVMREALKRQAVAIGGHAADAAKYCGKRGINAFQEYVQQGPQGVSVLCFAGGLATSILSGMSVCNFFGSVLDPFHYILILYVFVFGLVTSVVEADTDRVGMLMTPFDRLAQPLTRAQAWLHEECRLLTRLRGRGFFYLYQGTMLLITQSVLSLLFINGFYLLVMGALCIMMSFGITPDIEGMLAGVDAGGPYGPVGGRHQQAEVGCAGASPIALPVEEIFVEAESAWKREKDKLSGKACRELWALHQQATAGDCSEPRPEGVFNGSAKEQWRLWMSLRGTEPEDAGLMFVDRLAREGVAT